MLTLLTIYIISKDEQANRYFSYYNKINNDKELSDKMASSIKIVDENIIRYFLG